MKEIKLHYLGFWDGFSFGENLFSNLLKKHFRLVFDDKDPDFLIYTPLCKPFEYMRYDCPRILFSGEPLSADFNVADYFIGFDDITFGDRVHRFPIFLYDILFYNRYANPITEDEARGFLKEKEYFCNYIFGHDTVHGIRERILEAVSTYKRVECAGRHRNNMPGGLTFNMQSKIPFMEKCKFSIASESMPYPGFTSEKICHAFQTHTVPIYFGDPDISKYFNVDSFVNYSDFENLESLVKRIIQIDQDDDLYIHMLCQFRYNTLTYEQDSLTALEKYLVHIFEQDKDTAYRRPRYYQAKIHETNLYEYYRYHDTVPVRIMRKLGM